MDADDDDRVAASPARRGRRRMIEEESDDDSADSDGDEGVASDGRRTGLARALLAAAEDRHWRAAMVASNETHIMEEDLIAEYCLRQTELPAR